MSTINREAAIAELMKMPKPLVHWEEVKKMLEAMAEAQPERKKGRWICWYEEIEHDTCTEYIPHCKCSECGTEYDPHSVKFINFCNYCGSKMQLSGEDATFNGNQRTQRVESVGDCISRQPFRENDTESTSYSRDTISRQAAIDAIFSEPLYESGMKKRDADAVVPAIYEKIKSLPSAQPKPHWIPCSERLPENGVRVLIMHGDCIEFGRYEDGEWIWLCESGTNYWEEAGKVDAWMPLPEPYKGGE